MVFIGLTVNLHLYAFNVSTAGMPPTREVAPGKHVWERHSCIKCHTLRGEGACFAPELGNVMTRWGVLDDPQTACEVLDGWMAAQPSGTPGRRQMPHFAITGEEMRGLAEFLRRADQTDTQGWLPTDAG